MLQVVDCDDNPASVISSSMADAGRAPARCLPGRGLRTLALLGTSLARGVLPRERDLRPPGPLPCAGGRGSFL